LVIETTFTLVRRKIHIMRRLHEATLSHHRPTVYRIVRPEHNGKVWTDGERSVIFWDPSLLIPARRWQSRRAVTKSKPQSQTRKSRRPV